MSTAVAKPNPVSEVSTMLSEREPEFKAALPPHIPVERFMRVVMTAIQSNPALARVERRSLFTAAMRSAQDGLLPDGREAALVIYRDKTRGEIAQYMPMIAGLRKKVRNSGEIVTWDAQVVHEADQFEYELGDAPFIRHKPAMGERGKLVGAYSVAVLKGGEKSREVMSVSEIESVRKRSRASDAGPWVTDYSEMCRKTVARRHSKVLPMSTDLDDLIRQDDALYDFDGARDDAKKIAPKGGLSERMAALAAPAPAAPKQQTAPAMIDHDPATGEISGAPASAGDDDDATHDAFERGREAKRDGLSRRAMPGEYRDDAALAKAWQAGHDEEPAPVDTDGDA